MLTGTALGTAIREAIEMKGVTQREVARVFDVKPPSIQDWMKKGTVSKDKLPALWKYFEDVVGPEHWGLEQFPRWPSRPRTTPPRVAGEPEDPDDAPTPYLPGFEALSIPVLSQNGSMGSGEDQMHDEVVVGRLTVSPQWVARTIKPLTKLENLRFIHGYGDSMDPTFADGDILLVDAGVQEPKIDGVYVLEANDRIYIKRVRQRMDGSFEVSSDNPNVRTVDVLDGSQPVAVRGRVVWAWNGKKL
jgi:transcriptional regulator with XRE-family HTH domain